MQKLRSLPSLSRLVREQEFRFVHHKNSAGIDVGSALIRGIQFELERVRDTPFRPLLSFRNETIFVVECSSPITHAVNNDEMVMVRTRIVSEIPMSQVASLGENTFGHTLRLADAIYRQFEQVDTDDASYQWLSSSQVNAVAEGNSTLEVETQYDCSSIIAQVQLRKLLPCIALLERNEMLLLTATHLLASFRSWTPCLPCILGGYQFHQSHEPSAWEYPGALCRMENAAIQAVMAIEMLVGKPGKRDGATSEHRFRQRWAERFSLSPDQMFLDSEAGLLEEYYRAFEVRNDSAHAWRDLKPKLRLESTLRCQVLAFLLFRDVSSRALPSFVEAVSQLNFSRTFEQETA